ncbi:hypothetical protein HPB52_013342 [Rhipicephalus sanguineus]|uniref:Uncharacterized protein n=1 Tax=Rhipicephalus sanguineus TaxID=34632 RepID=A0A9D4SQS4_RHISA|nr:hypothetical protein HPB52_013342 [Rhipicephalus sanguineus]
MTSVDIDLAFSFLSLATVEQLRNIEEMNIPWLPPMRGQGGREHPVRALRRTVESCPVLEQRLERLACFYCWMAPLQVLQPWTLMTLGDVFQEESFSEAALLIRIANAIRDLGRETTFVTAESETLVYGCVLVQDTEPRAPAHVICMCCWRSLPFMALYAPDTKVLPLLDVALTAVLGCDTEPLLCGLHEFLCEAYNEVHNYANRQREQ